MSDLGYTTQVVTIKGTGDLLTHNGQLADPSNPIARKMKDVSGKRKKTDADFIELADLEFLGGLYVSRGKITIPPAVIESMLVEGARSFKEGKIALAGAFVEQDVDFTFDGPTDVDERRADADCRLVVGVKIGQNRVMRCRPIFRNWSLTFNVSTLQESISDDMLERWVTAAGRTKGIGDWRPRYGRFGVVSVKKEV